MIVVQHLHPSTNVTPSLIYRSRARLSFVEAEDKAPIEEGHVYFAPADYHLLVEKTFRFGLSSDRHVQHARPSIDVLFESAAIAYGADACGVVLTGANQDGAAGLRAIADEGGFAMVQDAADAEFPLMPSSALKAVPSARTGTIAEIAKELSRISRS